MIEHQAYLLVRMEQLSEQGRREDEEQAARVAYGLTQLAYDLTRWTRALVRLPAWLPARRSQPRVQACDVRELRPATRCAPGGEVRPAA